MQLFTFRYFNNFLLQYTSPALCPNSFEETQCITKKCITIANCSKAGVENYFDRQATSPAYISSTDNMPTSTRTVDVLPKPLICAQRKWRVYYSYEL